MREQNHWILNQNLYASIGACARYPQRISPKSPQMTIPELPNGIGNLHRGKMMSIMRV